MTPPPSLGRYRINGEIGRGAMGVVYRGLDPALDRPVAIKVISARHASTTLSIEELERRFMREAKVSARINHPGVVTVFDAGREGDSLYLVMELVDGESLAQRMSRGEGLAAPDAFELCARVAEALGAAHALGVIHRDVKPANIMMCRDGRVKVADFGVAKAIGEGTDLTRTGTVLGSPAYMAPEQVRGEPVDGRADLFSLGVVLYELLLHRRPFPAETFTTLIYQILHEDPFTNEDVFRSLGEPTARFLRSCLAKSLDERVPDGASFAVHARALAAQATLAVAPTSLVETTPTRPVAGAQSASLTATAPTSAMAAAQPGERPPAPAREPVSERRLPLLPLAILGGGALVLVIALIVLRRPPAPAGEVLGGTAPPAVATMPPSQEPPPIATSVVAVATAAPLPTASPAAVPTAVMQAVRPPDTPTPAPTPTPRLLGVFACSHSAEFNVSPDDAELAINGTSLGLVSSLDEKTYVFPHPGVYYARMTLAGYRTAWVKIVVAADAHTEKAEIELELEKRD
ncbi:MAG: protein kinase domain-containing protein [Acidobacteriota bacterium]